MWATSTETGLSLSTQPLTAELAAKIERALQHAAFTDTSAIEKNDEGSRFHAAGMIVVEILRKRRIDAQNDARPIIAAARKGQPAPCTP